MDRNSTKTDSDTKNDTKTENGASVVQKSQAPGKTSVGFLGLLAPALQARGDVGGQSPEAVQAIAGRGVEGSGGALPHLETIQASFGEHDVSGVSSHVGGKAAEASASIGAEAYATGNDVAFKSSPTLHTAAHEAAHVVQQKAGVNLKGGVGAAGDAYEQHADAVADKVVAGESAAGLLSQMAPSGGASSVQRKVVQREGEAGAGTPDAAEPTAAPKGNKGIADQITELMSYGAFDWAITDSEATTALNLLAGLSGGTLTATLGQLTQQTRSRMLDNLPASAKATSGFTKVLCAMGPAQIRPYIQQLLTTGIFDWAVTDAEVASIFEIFKNLGLAQATALYQRMSAAFRNRLLDNMATGSDLTPTAKAVLWHIAQDPATSLTAIKRMFRVRFRHELTDTPEDPATTAAEGAAWTVPLIRQVWQQLNSLPDADVSDIQIWGAFQAINSGGGFYSFDHIELGVTATPAKMAHTVRHEVGHGVHDALKSSINSWLQNSIGFWYVDLASWVDALGGYPEKYTDPVDGEKDFDATAQGAVRTMIDSWTGSTAWGPTRATVPTAQTAAQQAMWSAMPAEVQNACAQSTNRWYNNYTNFQQVGGESFFANHWYHLYYKFSATAAAAIAATGDNYTAMSEQEFFANCYAEYFKDPAGIDDNSKWGGGLPASIKSFFDSVIVSRHPYSEWQAAQAASAGAGTGGTGG